MSYGKQRNNRHRPNIVFFDLECTGFDRPIRPVQVGSRSCRVLENITPNHTQIGAIDSWGENCFNEFIWPRRHVHPKASLTNNFTTDHKSLYR